MKTCHYGPCGLYCGACGATDCDGCHSDRIDDTIRNCAFRQCTDEKGIEFCCYCDEFPCNALLSFMSDAWPHHWTIESNLAYIKEHGKDKWLETRKKQWSCPECGKLIQWYQHECACGQVIEAWEAPV